MFILIFLGRGWVPGTDAHRSKVREQGHFLNLTSAHPEGHPRPIREVTQPRALQSGDLPEVIQCARFPDGEDPQFVRRVDQVFGNALGTMASHGQVHLVVAIGKPQITKEIAHRGAGGEVAIRIIQHQQAAVFAGGIREGPPLLILPHELLKPLLKRLPPAGPLSPGPLMRAIKRSD